MATWHRNNVARRTGKKTKRIKVADLLGLLMMFIYLAHILTGQRDGSIVRQLLRISLYSLSALKV